MLQNTNDNTHLTLKYGNKSFDLIDPTSKHLRYFDLAKRISSKSTHYQYKLGSVIVNRSKIISIGFNQLKSNPHSPHPYKAVHAEFHSVLGVDPADLIGADIYIYRQNKSGHLAMAKPCKFCEKMLKDADLKNVFFTTYGGFGKYSFY